MQTVTRTILVSAVLAILVLSFAIPTSAAYGPKHVKVSQSQIDKYLKQMKHTNAPSFTWPNGAAITASCGTDGCALSFNEQATKGLEALMAAGIGAAGVAAAILTITGVGVPAAAVVGLVLAMFAVTGSWMGFADWYGGSQGIYGAWYSGSLLFYIWCNPVPSNFLTMTTSTTTTTTTSTSDPVTTTTTITTTVTVSSSSTSTFTGSSFCTPKVCIYAPQ